jgi:hypothetical protein
LIVRIELPIHQAGICEVSQSKGTDSTGSQNLSPTLQGMSW